MLQKNFIDKKYLKWIALGLLLGLLLIINLWSAPDNNLFEIIEDDTVYITFTNEGFSPDHIIIKLGARVVFTNESDGDFWPASNNHPEHSAFPEFDPREPVASGSQWEFVFNKPGTWQYHDHIKSFFGGTVVVVGSGDGYKDINECRKFSALEEQEKSECFEQFGVESLWAMDLQDAFVALNYFYQEKPEIIPGSCHNHMHILGDIAYKEVLGKRSLGGIDWPQEALFMCEAGFLHGFLEHYIKDIDDFSDVRETCEVIAQKYESSREHILSNCYHGVGHGYMVEPQIDSDQWGSDYLITAPAVEKCTLTFNEGHERSSCFSGVFNTIALWKVDQLFGLDLDYENPYTLCDAQSTPDAKLTCYEMEVAMLSDQLDWDIVSLFDKYVLIIPDEFIRWELADIIISGKVESSSLDTPPAEYLTLCHQLHSSFSTSCINAVVNGFMAKGGAFGEEYKPALEFCKLDQLTQREKLSCYSKLARRMDLVYSPEQIEMACSEFESDEYRDLCFIENE